MKIAVERRYAKDHVLVDLTPDEAELIRCGISFLTYKIERLQGAPILGFEEEIKILKKFEERLVRAGETLQNMPVCPKTLSSEKIEVADGKSS